MAKKKYVRVKDRRVGLKVKDRTQSKVEKNGNQWTVTPKQMKFVEYWLTAESETFGNAYQSALKAGFSVAHAKQITSKAYDLKWVSEARRRLTRFRPEHILAGYQQAYDQAPKWSDKLHALDSMGKIAGMFIERSVQQIDVQFTNAVPRPTIEVEPTEVTDTNR